MSGAGMDPVAWLAGQQGAMLDLLARMVDLDSGSYDKPGVDAVGDVVREFLAGHGVAVEQVAGARMGDCLLARVPGSASRAAAIARGRCCCWGTATRVPQGRGGAAAVHGAGRHGIRPRGRGHEGGAGDELLPARSFAQPVCRWRWRRCSPATRRSAARGPRGDRAPGPRARAVLNAEPGRPSGRGGDRAQGRRVQRHTHHRPRRAFRRQLRGRDQRDRGVARKVQALHALTRLERGITVNVGLVGGGQSVNTSLPGRRRRWTCATWRRLSATR